MATLQYLLDIGLVGTSTGPEIFNSCLDWVIRANFHTKSNMVKPLGKMERVVLATMTVFN